MSTPATSPVENPWKKRRKGPQTFMPPSRALLAEFQDGHKETATWIVWFKNGWKCISASGNLKWMKGSTNPEYARKLLVDMKVNWHWIEPNTVRAIAPPF